MYRIVLLLCFLLCRVPLQARPAQPVVPGEWLVITRPEVDPSLFEQLSLAAVDCISPDTHIWWLRQSEPLLPAQQLRQQLTSLPGVVSVAQNRRIQFRTTPNDPEYAEQTTLRRVQLEFAWDLSTGGQSALGDTIVVAILEQGFEPTHADLWDNIWHNPAEIPGDNIDNDGNGLVDDDLGWNYMQNRPGFSRSAHGNSVAGLIGARGNNSLGICGVNWDIKLMLFQVINTDHIVRAYQYIIDQRRKYNESQGQEGAFVVATNASFGFERTFCDEPDAAAWGAMYPLLGANGVLTAAATANDPYDVDQEGDMPSSCTSPYLITSMCVDAADQKCTDSAYGVESIDLASPGDGAYSTGLSNSYRPFNKNSAAAPHLAGTIALLYSLNCPDLALQALREPSQAALRVRQAILDGVDPINGLDAYTATGGRLNVYRAAQFLIGTCDATTHQIKLSPNPARQQVRVNFLSMERQPVELMVYDALGRQMQHYHWTFDAPGFQQHTLNCRDWPVGVYWVSLRQVGQTAVAKMIKL